MRLGLADWVVVGLSGVVLAASLFGVMWSIAVLAVMAGWVS